MRDGRRGLTGLGLFEEISRPLMRRRRYRDRLCRAARGLLGGVRSRRGPGGKGMGEIRLLLWRHFARYFLVRILPLCHALTFWSVCAFGPSCPMAALRCRRLLDAVAFLVGHLGGGSRPWRCLYIWHGERTRERRTLQPSASSAGRDELVVLQQLRLMLRYKQGQQVICWGVRAGGRGGVGERTRARRGGSWGPRCRGNADATPVVDWLVGLVWFHRS